MTEKLIEHQRDSAGTVRLSGGERQIELGVICIAVLGEIAKSELITFHLIIDCF